MIYQYLVHDIEIEFDKHGFPTLPLLNVDPHVTTDVFSSWHRIPVHIDDGDSELKVRQFLEFYDLHCPGERHKIHLRVRVRRTTDLPRYRCMTAVVQFSTFGRANGCNVSYVWKLAAPNTRAPLLCMRRKRLWLVQMLLLIASAIALAVLYMRE